MTGQPGKRRSESPAPRADVFGDVVPVTSDDERPEAWGDGADDPEEALRREVPPHSG